MFIPNSQLLTDSYKVTHWLQYPPRAQAVHSYLSARGGVFPEVLVTGYTPKLHFLQEFIRRPADLTRAAIFWESHFGNGKLYNRKAWEQIYELGYLPLHIRAVPEGTSVPNGNVLMTFENTDDRFPWLTNWFETLMMQTWYPITVGTYSRECKKLILKYLELTGDPAGIGFKLHDFGFRGVSSVESAAIGGAAHLVNFLGTDTPVAIAYLETFYGAIIDRKENAGFSIPAAEHSTITSWGRSNEEYAALNMLEQFSDGLVAIVGDSYDIYNFTSMILGEKLKYKIEVRDGVVVVRPDSGYPPEVVTRCLDILWDKFGGTTNAKGFRVLNPHVRLIQGDGVDYDMIRNVLHAMFERKLSADNVAFGMGGALLQKLNRDTQKMAIKCSAIKIDGVWQDVYKDPVTDREKKSHAGRLALVKQNGEYKTVPGPVEGDLLVDVFHNGRVLQHPTIYEIRERATC